MAIDKIESGRNSESQCKHCEGDVYFPREGQESTQFPFNDSTKDTQFDELMNGKCKGPGHEQCFNIAI